MGVEFQLKTGPITCVGLTQTYDGHFKFVVAEGESLAGPIVQMILVLRNWGTGAFLSG